MNTVAAVILIAAAVVAQTSPPGTIGKPRITDDPKKDGWFSELLQRRTDKTLKKWAAYLSNNSAIDAKELEHFVDGSFACGRLRPAKLDVVFDEPAVTVKRPADGELKAGRTATRHGAEGFKEALDELLAPMAGASSRRAAIKTIRVEPDTTPPSTFVRIEVSAQLEHSVVQQVCEWTCRWKMPEGDDPGALVGIDVERFEEAAARGPTGTLFADCTLHVLGGNPCFERQLLPGSDDWLARMDQRIGYDTRGHQGIAIGDVNGDGLEDLYVCQAAGLPNRLFIHQPDGTALEASASAGVDFLEPTHSALFLDLDNDGDQDLVVAAGFQLLLLSNDGSGHFKQEAGLKLSRPATTLAAADVDNDGDLDLYACVFYSDTSDPGALAHPLPLYDANNGGRNQFFRNDTNEKGAAGGFKFTDVTDAIGLGENNTRWSWACSFEDYDNDGDQDLYVANDFGRGNLYRNEGGRFHDAAATTGVENSSFGMSVSWGDWNRDGFMDLYVGSMFSSAGNRVTYQRNFKPGISAELLETYHRLARGNTLFQNLGDGRFADVSVETNTTMGRWAWGSVFVDADNDGWPDLFVGNGYLTNVEPDDL